MKLNRYPFEHRLRLITLLIAIIFPVAGTVYAQQAEIVTYLKNDGRVVADKDSADYIRIIRAPEQGQKLYTLQEYYHNGNLKRTGQVISPTLDLRFEGKVTTYEEDGGKQAVSYYIKNRLNGLTERYYRNGQLKEQVHFKTDTAGQPGAQPLARVIQLYDSLGAVMVTNGNGYARYFSNNGRDMEEGSIVDGVKNGVWKGNFQDRRYTFEETYEQGKLVSGVSTNWAGDTFSYIRTYVGPEYPGGMKAFYQAVSQRYRYPKEAIQQGVNGELELTFVVDTTGRLDDIRVVNELGYGTGEEALRVLKGMGEWQPGQIRGVPVRVSHTLPIRLRVQKNVPPPPAHQLPPAP